MNSVPLSARVLHGGIAMATDPARKQQNEELPRGLQRRTVDNLQLLTQVSGGCRAIGDGPVR